MCEGSKVLALVLSLSGGTLAAGSDQAALGGQACTRQSRAMTRTVYRWQQHKRAIDTRWQAAPWHLERKPSEGEEAL